MPDETDNKKTGSALAGLFRNSGIKVAGGAFSLLFAALFGGFRFFRRKKKMMSENDIRLTAVRLLAKLENVRGQLDDFQARLRKQEQGGPDAGETRQICVGLKKLYNLWTSHESMQEVLNTVSYDPQIGMNVSNGLHELRGLIVLMDALPREESPEGAISAQQLVAANEYLDRAIGFFNYRGKDAAEPVPHKTS